ncbi:MAG: type II toxin-antitoxin system PemK/MazF family toxin [Candidatus Omnitrophica bacterium]|nr:type II toxin-antitoxin system PemK/MazF family toxin [Candidatus Omnitrophota bacterium]
MRRGDIVLIKFPFSDLSSSKVRPALVISSNSYTQKGRDAIFMLISSNNNNPQDTDLFFDVIDPDFTLSGLKKASWIKTDKIVILSKALAIRRLGKLGSGIMAKINAMLSDVLGLDLLSEKQISAEQVSSKQSSPPSSESNIIES